MLLADRLLWLRRLAVVCVALAFAVMVLGSWVKATGSGLSCPDWPQCYGEWLPPFPDSSNGGVWEGKPVTYTQDQILYEWAHRAVVSVLLLPLASMTFVAWRGRELHPALRRLPAAGLGLYFFQAFLGAVTVVTGNPAWATTAHLATATTFFFVLTSALHFAFLRPLPAAQAVRIAPAAPAGRPIYPGEET
jgi:cytochrome c oxidase assembly protein subunit 15